MAKHLSGKTSRLISDFLTIDALTALIPHEMEKRMVARHGLIKLDALLSIAPRYKNALRSVQSAPAVATVESLLAQLRRDYEKSHLEIGRDAMSAHTLHLDLLRIVQVWTNLNRTVFAVLADDLRDLDAELALLDPSYPRACTWALDATLPAIWSQQNLLGDPSHPRFAIIYGSLATAGIVAPLPGGARVQDATIRVSGLMTFLMQLDRLRQPLVAGSDAERLFAEMIVIDFIALWEALFTSTVRNDHGDSDLNLLEQWRADGWNGVGELEQLEQAPHPDVELWRTQVRNRTAAHMDADVDIWLADVSQWPMTLNELMAEAYRLMNAVRRAAIKDVRGRPFFIPPQRLGGSEVIGLSGQEGRLWSES